MITTISILLIPPKCFFPVMKLFRLSSLQNFVVYDRALLPILMLYISSPILIYLITGSL